MILGLTHNTLAPSNLIPYLLLYYVQLPKYRYIQHSTLIRLICIHTEILSVNKLILKFISIELNKEKCIRYNYTNYHIIYSGILAVIIC